jgi:hypothetical protein
MLGFVVRSQICLGAQEAASRLGLSRQALHNRRRRQPDFPEPLAELASGPIWSREQLVSYAQQRARQWHERPAIEALAEEAEVLTVEDAARVLGVSPAQVAPLRTRTRLCLSSAWTMGEIKGVRRDAAVLARVRGRGRPEGRPFLFPQMLLTLTLTRPLATDLPDVEDDGDLAGVVAVAERHRLHGDVREHPRLRPNRLARRVGQARKRLGGEVPAPAKRAHLALDRPPDALELQVIHQPVDDRLTHGVGDNAGREPRRQMRRRLR